MSTSTHIAVVLPCVRVGGVETMMSNLLDWFTEQRLRTDLVVMTDVAPEASHLCTGATRSIVLGAGSVYGGYAAFVRYLRRARPRAILAAQTPANLLAVLGAELIRPRPVVAVSVHIAVDVARSTGNLRAMLRPVLYRTVYNRADAVIGVSHGVSGALRKIGIRDRLVRTIYNPVVRSGIVSDGLGMSDPWLDDPAMPVIMAMGRLELQKDFATLLHAFAIVRSRRPARLLVLGDGSQRVQLERLVAELGITECVRMPGFVEAPHRYVRKAAVFVLTSSWEGFGNVIAEALAVGTPVVSTDCPVGPAEILADGRYGRLVPVGDAHAVAQAILDTLNCPPDRADLIKRGHEFSSSVIGPQYLDALGF